MSGFGEYQHVLNEGDVVIGFMGVNRWGTVAIQLRVLYRMIADFLSDVSVLMRLSVSS